MTQDNTSPGRIFKATVIPHQVRIQNQTTCFRKALRLIFPTIPCSGPTLSLLLSNRALKNRPRGCVILCHIRYSTPFRTAFSRTLARGLLTCCACTATGRMKKHKNIKCFEAPLATQPLGGGTTETSTLENKKICLESNQHLSMIPTTYIIQYLYESTHQSSPLALKATPTRICRFRESPP